MKRTFSALLLVLLLVVISTSLFGCVDSDEMKTAKAEFTSQSKRVASQQAELKTKIAEGNITVAAKEKMLNPELLPKLETSISGGKAVIVEIPAMPKKLEDILAKTKDLKATDCTSQISAISDATKAVKDSIAQFKLVKQPSEAYVIQCLKTITDIKDISAVTEENDPNGHLNKDGGYSASVYFTSPLVDTSKAYFSKNDSVIEKGTDGGGCIEVYKTTAEAEKRAEYLATYDGGLFASGSHKVIGTVLVRTSNYMTASRQDKLEQKIIDALTKLP